MHFGMKNYLKSTRNHTANAKSHEKMMHVIVATWTCLEVS